MGMDGRKGERVRASLCVGVSERGRDRQTDRETDRQTDRQTERERASERQREREEKVCATFRRGGQRECVLGCCTGSLAGVLDW